jgi:hypothetical protein
MNSTPLFHALTTAEALYSKHAEEELKKNNGKRKRRIPRLKRDIRREQEELEKKTKLEIDILVAEFHAKLPRSKAEAIGAIYARYSSRFQDSILDQVRELLERALAEGIFVPRENIFYDLAVRGWKDSRPGLNRLRQAIDLYQQGERKQAFGWLQGRVHVDIVGVLVKRLTGVVAPSNVCDLVEVVIDYKKSKLFDEQVETAKRLWDEGMLHVEIAEQMSCHRSYVTKMIHHWFDSRNIAVPNCKKRRKRLEKKQRKIPTYKIIANQVSELMEAGQSNLSIANQLNTTDTTVAKSIAWWHQMRDLPVPTAADRRQKKLARAKTMFDDGKLLSDIAEELDYSPRGLTLALEKYFEKLGETMPDGRSRRGNASAGASANGNKLDDSESGDAQAA